MNKKIIISLGAAALLASSLVAFFPECDMQGKNNFACKKEKMMQGRGFQRGPGIAKMFMQLDLSDAQKIQIKTIIGNHINSMPSPKDAFTENSFDKKAFVSLVRERIDGKIEFKAQMIEKVYAVLNTSQKKEFKSILDTKKNKRMQMMGF